MRAFLALDVKDKKTIKSLEIIQSEIKETGTDVKLVELHNLHFTIKFFGEINEDFSKKIINSLKNENFEPLSLTYKGIGVFPNLRRINVIWVGIEKSDFQNLLNVITTVDEKLKGIVKREQGFKPHITICRVKSVRNREKLLAVLKKYESIIFGQEKIMSLKLKRSTLTSNGPIYTDIHEFNLGV